MTIYLWTINLIMNHNKNCLNVHMTIAAQYRFYAACANVELQAQLQLNFYYTYIIFIYIYVVLL